ncbi:phage terminase small subunit [Desulfocurvibacter africanus]|uniref:phage terminase small subunit n=1 Tax=Desulfocurvibacter africanus TaxID=873 RepID=UPI00040501D8|nr:phage terminase small subunit [Desulfocurvibacter africanus]
MGLMRNHQQAMQASRSIEPAGQKIASGARVLGTMPTGLMGGQKLAAMLSASLTEDLKALHNVASVERKADIKRNALIPKYRDYVERLMADGQRHDLIGWFLVWCFDAGCIEDGLRVAFWCLEHGQTLPERFKASLPLFVATQLLEWAEREYNAERTFEPYLSIVLLEIESDGPDSGNTWDLPDQVKAGFHRLLGLQAEREGKLSLAAQELERAFALGAKVKTALEAVKKRLARDGGQDGQDEQQQQPSDPPEEGGAEA